MSIIASMVRIIIELKKSTNLCSGSGDNLKVLLAFRGISDDR